MLQVKVLVVILKTFGVFFAQTVEALKYSAVRDKIVVEFSYGFRTGDNSAACHAGYSVVVNLHTGSPDLHTDESVGNDVVADSDIGTVSGHADIV